LAAPGILQALLESLEVDVAGLWIPSDQDDTLRLSAMITMDSSADLRSFLEASQNLSLKSGLGLPGRVWESGLAIWLTDLAGDGGFRRRESANRAGLHSGMAFPIQNDGRLFAVLEIFTRRRLEHHEIWLGMMAAIGGEIGQFTHRRDAEEALRRAHDELEIRVQRRTAELKAANTKLQAAISERKRLENELLEITEKERRRIALDLHDDLGQQLSGIALMTKGLELKLTKIKAESAVDAARIHSLVQEAMSHASDLAHDLATLDLQTKTLPEALGDLAAHARELFKISCEYQQREIPAALDASVVMQLYKIAQEALTNAIKHGKTTSAVIELEVQSEQMILTIRNNGLPFPDLEGRSTGMGLRIMNYRASLIGGSLEIKADGSKGTRVTCFLPIEKRN
jgi:signal transduction histidine kinase